MNDTPPSAAATPATGSEELGGTALWLSRERIMFVGLLLCSLVLAGALLELRLHASNAIRHWNAHLSNRVLALQLQSAQLQLQWLREIEQSDAWPNPTATTVSALAADMPEFVRLCVSRPPSWQVSCAAPRPGESPPPPGLQGSSMMPSEEPVRWLRMPGPDDSPPTLAVAFNASDSSTGSVIVAEVDRTRLIASMARAMPDRDFSMAFVMARPSETPPSEEAAWREWFAWFDWPHHLDPMQATWPGSEVRMEVALDASAPRAEWRVHVIRIAWVTCLLLGLFVFLTASAYRSWTARLLLRQRLSQTRQALHEQLAFSARLLQASPTPTYVKDLQGRYIHINEAYESHVGLPRQQLLGKSIQQLFPHLDVSRHRAHDEAVMAERKAIAVEYERLQPERGRSDTMLVTKAPLLDEQGEVVGLIGTVTDITALKAAERSILAARDAAQAANAAKSEFIGNMSHELRTPLQSILGFSELGISRFRADPKVLDLFQTIWRGGDRMLSLVNDLLDLSKLESANHQMTIAPMQLPPLIREVVFELQPLAQKRRIQFQLEMPSEWMVAADRKGLWQVLRNVLANAVKFSPADAAIELRLVESADGWLQLAVRDHGPGIPEDELEAIFNPFVQSTRTKDGSGGTGLGLAICRRILEAHGGHIQARNVETGGAEFSIRLPPVNCPGPVLDSPGGVQAPGATAQHIRSDGCQSCPARLASGKRCEADGTGACPMPCAETAQAAETGPAGSPQPQHGGPGEPALTDPASGQVSSRH